MVQEFSYETAVRGQEISEEEYYKQLDLLPPISLRAGQGWAGGFQTSGPWSHAEDLKTGQWRGLYATFTSSGGRYFFQGYNFAGEVDSRPYLRKLLKLNGASALAEQS